MGCGINLLLLALLLKAEFPPLSAFLLSFVSSILLFEAGGKFPPRKKSSPAAEACQLSEVSRGVTAE